MLCTFATMRTKWSSRVLVPAFVLLGSNLAAAAPPPVQEKADAKKPTASLHDYLPTIRLKALRDIERQSVADLEEWHGKYALYVNGLLVDRIQRSQIEEEYHRSRLRALRLDTDYRDSLDLFRSKFHASEQRRRQMEDAAISAIVKVFQRFEELPRDYLLAIVELDKLKSDKDVTKLRPGAIQILTKSALVKNTVLPKRFLKRWDEWKKIDDRRELRERTTKIREDHWQLHIRQLELSVKQQELPEADKQRMDALEIDRDLGEFQLVLLICENQEWKDIRDDAERLRRRLEHLHGLERSILSFLDDAYTERLYRLCQSWPVLAEVKIKDVDLLNCKLEKAEETVASLLKTPDAQRAGRKQIRRLRTLAESYPIQQRLFQIAFVTRDLLKKDDKLPSPPPGVLESDNVQPGLVGPIGRRPQPQPTAFKPEYLLKREASFARAKRQLLQTGSIIRCSASICTALSA